MIKHASLNYVLSMLVCLAVLITTIYGLLWWRRNRRQQNRSVLLPNLALATWMLLAFLTGCELYFANFVDHSDAFNMTNISKRWFRVHIEKQRNNQGCRDVDNWEDELPPGTKRVCFFGDSFTIGHGINNMADRFSDRIAAELEQTHPGEYVVANFGEPGYDVSLVESYIHALLSSESDVDVVVYVFTPNDIEGYDNNTKKAIRAVQDMQPQSPIFTETYFFNWLYYRYLQHSRPEVQDYFPHLVDSYESEAWQGMAKSLQMMNGWCRERGVELRIVLFPFVQHLGPDYPFRAAHQKMIGFCNKNDIRVLNLEPVLSKHDGETLTVNRFDPHPNERANEIAAEAIREQLLDDLFTQTVDSASTPRDDSHNGERNRKGR